METTKERLQHFVKELGYGRNKFEESIGIASGYLSSKSITVASDVIEKVLCYFPELDANWLFTGKGDMYKNNTAGRDNVGTGNEIAGDNKGVIGNTGTVGNVGGNHVSIGDSSNIKKIMNEEGVSIEFAQSVDSLQQTNAHLEIRIKDLETINASQSKTIETMQLLIDTLTKK